MILFQKACSLFVVVLFTLNGAFSQTPNQQQHLVQAYLQKNGAELPNTHRRSMYRLEGNDSVRKNPVNVFFSGLMYVYQNVFSEQISASCMYQISCSEYTKLCIEENGLLLGSVQGFHQLMHCTPGATEEVPPYMYSVYSLKILNHVEKVY